MGKDVNILVAGGGFVGITLAAKLLKIGHINITILETNNNKLQKFTKGNFGVFEPGLDEILLQAISEKRLIFCSDIHSVFFDSIFICIGTTFYSKNPESMSNIVNLSMRLAQNLTKNGFLFIRSTVRIGTTTKILNELKSMNRSDIKVLFAPERTIEGNAIKELDLLPQILAASNDASFNSAKDFLKILEFNVIKAQNYEAAEFAKLISNAWRDSIFAISNEIAILGEFLNLDSIEILNLVNDRYPRAKIPNPGPVGGPCLTKDTHILFESFPEEIHKQSLILSARLSNERLFLNASRKIDEILESRKNLNQVLFLGLAFKSHPKTNDIRNGFSTFLIDGIISKFANIKVKVWDPSLDDIDFQEYINFKVEEIDPKIPQVVILGNNGENIQSEKMRNFLNNLSSESFIVDFWGVTANLKINSTNGYFLGKNNKGF